MKKRTYLYRLSKVMLLGLFFPAILFFLIFWKYAFDQIERGNEDFYENALLKEENSFKLKEELEQWLKENYAEEYPLYTGKTVDKPENIQLSFRSCLSQMKKKRYRWRIGSGYPTIRSAVYLRIR